MNYSDRLNRVIPGGAHTYSRGDDQFPENAPQILSHGKGAYVYDPGGKKYLDYGMALRAVSLGYSEETITAAALRGLEAGNNLTRASTIELEAAELIVNMIDSVDMVKFTKNGSTATSAAVKLARGFTGRKLVGRCTQHPFFSYDDWFIGNTPITKGIPDDVIRQTVQFDFNSIESLQDLIAKYGDDLACIILEPAALNCPALEGESKSNCCNTFPCSKDYSSSLNYLQKAKELCSKHGIVFILDEMITGFRWDLKGAQHIFNVKPDLSTFGKAMANGLSVAAVAGRRDIMEQGSIDTIGAERMFLLSTTHGAEMSGLAAFIETMKFMEQNSVIEYLWNYGRRLVEIFHDKINKYELNDYFEVGGPVINPYYITTTRDGNTDFQLRTLFAQEMIKNGVLMPWLSFSYQHGQQELAITEKALDSALAVCKTATVEGVENYLVGPTIKPVFRRFN